MYFKIFLLPLVLVLGVVSTYSYKDVKDLQSRRKSAENNVGIFDGKNTTINEHPYLVGILVDNQFNVAGAVLTNKWVITINYWIRYYPTSSLTVVAGSKNGTAGTLYNVTEMVLYSKVDYDCALLKIDGVFKWSKTVGNISLPTSAPKVGTALTVAGWGDPGEITRSTYYLKEGEMRWFNMKECKQMYPYRIYGIQWTERLRCVYNKGKTTICFGDRGDPFVKDGVLYALAADGGMGWCTASALPVIVSNIYPIRTWIKKTINEH